MNGSTEQVPEIPIPKNVEALTVETEEIKETPKSKSQFLIDVEEYFNTLSTHKCTGCGKTFVYGEWQNIPTSKNGNGKRPHFNAVVPSRKGIEHSEHEMLSPEEAPKNYFVRWDNGDTLTLTKLIEEGKHVTEIAPLIGRTVNSVNNAIFKLNLRELYIQHQRNA